MNYTTATRHAEKFYALLVPVCERIEVVGSVKRGDKKSREEGVHDLEFLLIPKGGYPVPQFGDKVIYKTHLDKLLAELEQDSILKTARKKADGDRYKKREIVGADELNGFNLEMFIVTPATWGIQNLIRTGNSWFSHRCVTNKNSTAFDRETGLKMPGFLPNDLKYYRGKDLASGESCIKRGETIIPLLEEEHVFDLIFGKWIAPENRRAYGLEQK